MSAHPETRYVCDRCNKEEITPLQNAPVHMRMAGPHEWLLINVGADPGKPPSHLCAHCAAAFFNFMGGAS